MTNTEILCFVLGWQGGTIHQVVAELGCEIDQILNAGTEQMRLLCRLAQVKAKSRRVRLS